MPSAPWSGPADLQQERHSVRPEKPAVTSGIRLGTSAGTSRGFGEAEFRRVGELILKVVDASASAGPDGDPAVEATVLEEVRDLCRRFPIYR
jgi:glycine hydroxymethyltransferase